MTLSKFIIIVTAAFCGLAIQLQASAADDLEIGEVGGIRNHSFDPTQYIYPSYEYFSPAQVTLTMQPDGNLVLANQQGTPIWASTVSWQNCGGGQGTCVGVSNAWTAAFQPDGNLVIYAFIPNPSTPYQNIPVWASGTTAYESWSGTPGKYLSIQDNGDLVIFDADLNPLWAASWQSDYNRSAQQVSARICGC